MKITVKNRICNYIEYREKKKNSFKRYMEVAPKGIYNKIVTNNFRHPLFLNKRLIILNFEKKLIIWTWNKIKEICEIEMIDVGIEIFYRLATKHYEFEKYLKIHVAKLDSIRKVSDAFYVGMEYIMENLYDDEMMEKIYDTLIHIHAPLKIPWEYYKHFKDHLIDFFKSYLQRDWEVDFTEFWGIFLLQLWITVASGTLVSDKIYTLDPKKGGKMKVYNESLQAFFAQKSKKYKCPFEFMSQEDIDIIKKTYIDLKPKFEDNENNLGQLIFREMMRSGKFSYYFPADKFNAEYHDTHGDKINRSLIQIIENLENRSEMLKIKEQLQNTHHDIMIREKDIMYFMDIVVGVICSKTDVVLIGPELISWEKFLLFIFYSFSKKIYEV